MKAPDYHILQMEKERHKAAEYTKYNTFKRIYLIDQAACPGIVAAVHLADPNGDGL